MAQVLQVIGVDDERAVEDEIVDRPDHESGEHRPVGEDGWRKQHVVAFGGAGELVVAESGKTAMPVIRIGSEIQPSRVDSIRLHTSTVNPQITRI